MASGKQLAAVLIAVTFAAVLFTPFYDAVQDNSGDVTVTNESLTADPGTYQELKGYRINDGSETVYWYNSSSGSYETVSSPGDYEMDNDQGRIKLNSSGKASAGDDVKATYTYAATDSTTTTVLDLAPLLFALLMIGVIGAEVQKQM